MKIRSMHQSRDASLHHQAWLEFFSMRKVSDKSYTGFASCMEGLWARINHLTLPNQVKAEHGAELMLLGILFALPFDDHVCQSLTTQPSLSLEQVMEAFACVDMGVKLHLAGAESANAAHSSNCWKCNLPGHLAPNCPHTGAIKDLVIKCNAASCHGRRYHHSSSSTTLSMANAASTSVGTNVTTTPGEISGVAALFLTSHSNITNDWLCDSVTVQRFPEMSTW